jgi:hypothetical protein
MNQPVVLDVASDDNGYANGIHWREGQAVRFFEYPLFLKSPYWQKVRELVKGRARYRCELCAWRTDLEVHHKTYQHHGSEHYHLHDLICLCRECHAKFHDKLINPSSVPTPEEPSDPMPTSPVAKTRWCHRHMESFVVPKVHSLLIAYAKEVGGTLEWIPRIRTRLATEMSVSRGTICLALRILEDRGVIEGAYGTTLSLYGGKR